MCRNTRVNAQYSPLLSAHREATLLHIATLRKVPLVNDSISLEPGKTKKVISTQRRDLNQPRHPNNLIRCFAVCSVGSLGPKASSSEALVNGCTFYYTPPHKKCRGIMLYPPNFECPSVCLSVCLSVSASFSCSNFSTFGPIFFNICIDIGIGEEWYGIASGLI